MNRLRYLWGFILVCAVFSAGNVSAAVQPTPPPSSSASTSAPPVISMIVAPTADSRTYAINLTVVSGSPTEIQRAAESRFLGVTWERFTPTYSWYAPTVDGISSLYVHVRDASGATSETVSAGLLQGQLSASIIRQYFTFIPTSSGDFSLQPVGSTDGLAPDITNSTGQSIAKSSPDSAAIIAPMASQQAYSIRVSGTSTARYTYLYQFALVDRDPPSVTIAKPASTGNLTGTVALEAAATDPSGIQVVDWLVDGTAIASVTTAPYSFAWDTTKTANGSHTLTARASDTKGNAGVANLNVTLANDLIPPTITATSLPPMVTTRTLNLQMTARDDLGGPVQVRVSDRSDFSHATWQPLISSLAWQLTGGDGPKTVYLQAQDQAGNQSNATALTTVLDTQHEPNDTLAQAAGAPLDQGITGRIAVASDVDYYRVTATTSGWLRVSVSGAAPSLQLLKNGQSVCDQIPCSARVDSGDTYYVRLYGSPNATTDYQLQASIAAAPDHSTTATALDLPSTGVDGTLDGPGDRDMYRIQASTTGTLQVQLTASTTLGVTYTLLNSQGDPIERLPDGTYPVTQGNTYYVQVQGSGWSTTDTYHLSTAVQTATPPAPCLTTDAAIPLQLGTQAGTMPADAPTCYFRYTPTVNGTLTMQMSSGSKQDLDLALLDSRTRTLSTSTAGLGLLDTIEYNVQAGQTYFVAVQYYSGSRGAFSLQSQLTPTPQAFDPYEMNDSISTATPLLAGDTLHARVDNPADVDVFAFRAAHAGSLTIDLTPPADADLDIDIRTADGAVLNKSANGIGLTERLTLPISTGQALYLYVYYYSGTVPAAYTLHTEFKSPEDSAVHPPSDGPTQGITLTGSSASGEVANANDVVLYRWQATATGAVAWSLTVPAKSDLDLDILNTAGQVISSSHKGLGLTDTCTFQAAQGGVYNMRITYYSGRTPAPYTLSQTQP